MKTGKIERKPQRKQPWGIRLVEAELKRAFDNGFELGGGQGTMGFYLEDPSYCFDGKTIEDCLVLYLRWKAHEALHTRTTKQRKQNPLQLEDRLKSTLTGGYVLSAKANGFLISVPYGADETHFEGKTIEECLAAYHSYKQQQVDADFNKKRRRGNDDIIAD